MVKDRHRSVQRRMSLSEELEWRGFVNQTTLIDLRELDARTWTFYHGFDASADSQTVGNLAGMMCDKVFMRHGCTAYILAGGATSLIGDPGGKDAERPMQNEATIRHNVECAKKQLKRIFKGYTFTLVNNLDWTKNKTVISFLRDIGKYFSMTPLIQRDYIARRIGEGGTGISYTEFSYTLLQGMDFLHLFDTFKVILQVGSSDQWSNCLSGVELIRRARDAEAHIFTHPLIINKSTGKKFGKSEEGAIWLDPVKTSPFQFYQFWLNSDDEGVEDYLKVFTELDKSAVDNIMSAFNNDRSNRAAQKALAWEVTKLIHGDKKAAAVRRTSEVLFGERRIQELKAADIAILKAELPSKQLTRRDDLSAVLVATGLAVSRSEAMRLISQGAITVNDQKITVADAQVLNAGNNILKRGKNQFAIVEMVADGERSSAKKHANG